MADSQSKRQRELEALLAERRKYEMWLAQLEARRSDAAEHVFTRVHADYSKRLEAVRGKLVGEADAIGALVADLEARLSVEHDAVTVKTDERSEAELRALVGEYSDKEWNAARAKLDDAIAERRNRFDATERELAELKELLHSVSDESPEPRKSAQQSAAAVVEDDLAGVAGPDSPGGEFDSAAGDDSASGEAAYGVLDGSGVESIDEPVRESDPPSGSDDAGDGPEPTGLPGGAPSPLSPPDTAEAQGETLGFDELAFLRSVAGTPAQSGMTTVISDNAAPSRSAEQAPARGRGTIDEPAAPARPSAPIPAPDSDEPAPLGAPTPRTSQAVRSLKCQECGTLNFPTEWYCERCGGELAAF